MKKLRIFLGATALLVAVGGAFAMKANTKFTTYYYQSAPNTCSSENITLVGCANGSNPCTDASSRAVFSSQGDGHICSSPIELKP